MNILCGLGCQWALLFLRVVPCWSMHHVLSPTRRILWLGERWLRCRETDGCQSKSSTRATSQLRWGEMPKWLMCSHALLWRTWRWVGCTPLGRICRCTARTSVLLTLVVFSHPRLSLSSAMPCRKLDWVILTLTRVMCHLTGKSSYSTCCRSMRVCFPEAS